MSKVPSEQQSAIFISYRCEDSAGYAGRLFDRLSRDFPGRVFMDIDTIEPGTDFVEVINQAVGCCEVLIVMIGNQWLSLSDANGRRRLDNPSDFVRLAIAEGLERGIRIIPVLVEGAAMPRPEDLPPEIAKLTRRNAIELSDARWDFDVERLIHTIEGVLHERAPSALAPAAESLSHPAPLPRSSRKENRWPSVSLEVFPEADEVHISAWHPRALPVGETAKLLVYAHLLSAESAVAGDAGQILGEAAAGYRAAEASASAAIAPGTEILLVPQGEGLRFDPPQARLLWSGAWQRADFTMVATGDRVGHVIEGSIACYVGPLLIADVRLPVDVPRSESPAAKSPGETGPALQSAPIYQAVFASYSHDDTPLVEAMEKAYKALGMDYLRDVLVLKSGQRWSDELLRMIERADIFQLFWSTPASRSTYVEQEWRHALGLTARKGPAFIRPICWERPVPAIPEPLQSLHFAHVDFPRLATVLGDKPKTGGWMSSVWRRVTSWFKSQ